MLAALAVVIPLGLGGAVSPVILTAQTVLLAGPDGGRAGVRYAAGVVLTTLVIVVAIVLFGRVVSLPTRPHLDATLDVVLGRLEHPPAPDRRCIETALTRASRSSAVIARVRQLRWCGVADPGRRV